MSAPLVIETPASVKDRLIHLLSALEYGLYPGDRTAGEQRSQAEADMAVASAAVTEVQDAANELEADRAFMTAVARLAGAGRRYRVDSGKFATTGRGR